MKKVFIVLLLIMVGKIYAQQIKYTPAYNYSVNSLEQRLRYAKTDANKVNLLDSIGEYFAYTRTDSALAYLRQALPLSQKLKIGEITTLQILGQAFEMRGDYPEALSAHFKALRLAENAGDKNLVYESLQQIGVLNEISENHQKASDYLTLVRSHVAELKRPDALTEALYTFAATAFLKMNKVDSAQYFMQKAYMLDLKAKSHWYPLYRLMADIQEKKGQHQKAIDYIRPFSHGPGLEIEKLFSCGDLAERYHKIGKGDSAIYFAREAIKNQKLGMPIPILQASKTLTQEYASRHQTDSAFKYQTMMLAISEHMFGREKTYAIEAITVGEQQRRQDLAIAEKAHQTAVRVYILSGTALALLIIGFILWRNNKKQKHTNQLLNEQKEQISAQCDHLEHQNHELEIEAALEQVRLRSMAMRQSNELVEVSIMVRTQVKGLGIPILGMGFIVWSDDSNFFTNYGADPSGGTIKPYTVDVSSAEMFKEIRDARKRGDDFFVLHGEGEQLKEVYQALSKYSGTAMDMFKDQIDPTAGQLTHSVFVSNVSLLFITEKPVPEAHDIFKRFGKTFEQTYTRFLDLKQAEEQAREAQIQLALERVRARTMAMQKSEELIDVSVLLHAQVKELGIEVVGMGFIVWNDDNKSFTNYGTNPKGGAGIKAYSVEISSAELFKEVNDARKRGDDFFVLYAEGERLKEVFRALSKYSGNAQDRQILKDQIHSITSQVGHWVFVSRVSLLFLTNEPVPQAHDIFKRFGKTFEQTYTRFLDLKQAEEQAREAQIQLALERVRARTMAMQKSEELAETVFVLFQQFKVLGENPDQATIGIFNEEERVIDYWVTMHGSQNDKLYKFSIDEPNVTRKIYDAWKAQKNSLVIDLSGKSLRDFMKYRAGMGGAAVKPGEKRRIINVALFSKGLLNVQSTAERSEESIRLLERFAQVFEQTYTRFLDLQKAEAQAREAKIEAALEKVRSRSLAMHQSNELREVVAVVFEKLQELMEIGMDGVSILTPVKGSKDLIEWVAGPDRTYAEPFRTPYIDHPALAELVRAMASGVDFFTKVFDREQKNILWEYAFAHSGYKNLDEAVKQRILASDTYAYSVAFQKNSAIILASISGQVVSDQEKEILKRFAKVFEQAYIRFLDLQKAEAQAREGQIQLALERVRARTMAMHNSDELTEVAALLFKQVSDLGIKTWTTGFNVWSDDNNSITDYITSPQGGFIEPYTLYASDNDIPKQVRDARIDGEEFLVQYVEGEQLKESYLEMSKLVSNNQFEKMLAGGGQFPSSQVNHFVFGSKVSLMFITYEPVPEFHDVFKRFGKVFEQTYTRFLDLQKAEAQAREAQIEAALEKVRSRSLAIHNSNELNEVVTLVAQKLSELGISMSSRGISIYIFNNQTKDVSHWLVSEEYNLPAECFLVPYIDDPLNRQFWQVKESGADYFHKEFTNEESNTFWRYSLEYTPYKKLPEEIKITILNSEDYSFEMALQKNSGVAVGSFGGKPLNNEEVEILKRFSRVFEQAYIRFMDMKKAEEQAREAQIEAALERVRSRTLAMQKSDELAETAAVLFNQMIGLGIEPNRLYIGITKDDNSEIEYWITDEDGSKVSNMFIGDVNKNRSMKKIHDAWKAHQKSMIIDMRGNELTEYFHYLGEILRVPFKSGLAQKRRVQYISFFSNGFIGMASPDDQPQETVDLLDRFAYVFNLTYARFNDLKIAESHAIQAEQDLIAIKAARKNAEDALTDLRAAQRQLVQSEKMASLGELTAGIAHEIQNPLNFVNNFSEVSVELIDEMAEELDKGEIEEVKVIAGDIKDNLEKIRHHGKRADSIVKGMLQHSRASSGQKEPTDLNVLADEYLRLSYHGLRAKDKSFNAELITNFDKGLPKISVIPQEMGRVILNLINNAFYATQQKQKAAGPHYKPTVEVKTQVLDRQVLISVKDNGIGVPENIRDKIMQPFFTTKPTGEGTGLGLSLSYDIVVKGHGGKINIKSKKGEGSEFIIDLPM